MKKTLYSLLTLVLTFSFTISTYACNTCGCKGNKENSKSVECGFVKNADGLVVCEKTGKVCGEDKKKCCKTDKNESSKKCSSKAENAFDYSKSNDYGNNKKSSCSSTNKKKSCCKSKNKTNTEE